VVGLGEEVALVERGHALGQGWDVLHRRLLLATSAIRTEVVETRFVHRAALLLVSPEGRRTPARRKNGSGRKRRVRHCGAGDHRSSKRRMLSCLKSHIIVHKE
jgi:hypothetical protein